MKSEGPAPAVRLALVGVGRWGANLARVAANLAGARLDVVCDLEPRHLERVRSPGVRLTIDEREALGPGVDAVLVATPSEDHVRHTLAALGAGKHVFVEKPLALTETDAVRVQRAAEEARRVVMVGHIVHYDAAYSELFRIVCEGILGPVEAAYAVRHAPSARGGLGAWWSLAPHDVSLLSRLLPGEATVSRVVRRPSRDHTTAHLTFSRGSATAVVDISGKSEAQRHFVVVGRAAVAVVDATEQWSTLRLLNGDVTRAVAEALRAAATEGRLAATCQGLLRTHAELAPLPIERREPLRVELEAFVDAITRGRPVPTSLTDALAVTRVLAAVDHAAECAGARSPAAASIGVVSAPTMLRS